MVYQRGRAFLNHAKWLWFIIFILVFNCVLQLIIKNGWGLYFWDRARYGDTVHVAGKCFDLPFGWGIFPKNDEGTVYVRRHFIPSIGQLFVVISPYHVFDNLDRTLPSRRLYGDYILYDIGDYPVFSEVRFIALSENNGVGMASSQENFLMELTQNLLMNDSCE